jgi:hypothetical protein
MYDGLMDFTLIFYLCFLGFFRDTAANNLQKAAKP